MTGDIDPRALADAEARRAGNLIDTETQSFQAVRSWVAELTPEAATWLAHAVHSGRQYSEWLASRR